jgi:chloride channel protein, CIC family
VANADVDAASKPGQLRSGLRRVLKFWVWFSEIAHPNDLQVTLFWAGVIGLFGALTCAGFRWATSVVHTVLTQQPAVSLAESFAHLAQWQRIVIPTVGGLIAGVVISFTKRWRTSITTADYMEAVVLGDGKISARLSLLKSLSAMFTIASGGSIGREGPLVQLSSMVASLAGRWQKWTTPRLRLLVGCGAAAGIASAYNAPIAGALFVAEIVLGSMAMEIFGPLVFSSVVATLTTRGLIGGSPLYNIPPFRLNSTWEIIPYLGLGVVMGVAAPWFLRLLDASERLFARVRVPVCLKLSLGGLVVGALAVVHPEVCGNGYSSVAAILRGAWLWPTLLSILIFKVLATTATFGSGAVGGVFTPTLFVGASIGYLFGALWHCLPGQETLNASALALVGMGAFLAGTTHAPIMAILMIFELTLDYQIILPLMLACVIGYYISVGIEKRSIYSEAVKRKGADDYRVQLGEMRVRELMKPNPIAILPMARFAEIGEKFVANRFNYLYVTQDGRFLGAVSLHDIKNYLNAPELAELVIAQDIMREPFPTIEPSASLNEALERFAHHDGERLPVVTNSKEGKLVGSISKTDIILAIAGSKKKATV